MARTPSNMRELGTTMPSFNLPDTVSGKQVSSDSLRGKPSVVIFICNHCPYVKHIRTGLAAFGRFCQERGVAMVAISSNDAVAYPDDSPEKMTQEAKDAGYVFPYLFDESQAVARAFDAACTPDLYIYDAQGKLAYRGQFDDARPKTDAPVTGKDARDAIEALLAGRAPSSDQKPSIGCNIKWKNS
ncbi:MAG TPA: thioredoxin family protein [Polyangiaceae bacterium]|nr:thioredoxin family protein [Polyangiaceae bacterium]